MSRERRPVFDVCACRRSARSTFDDLPAHGALPPGLGRADIARDILRALRAGHTPPVYGFVNARALDGGPDNAEVLRLWRAAGHPLANHTFSHMDLHANTPLEKRCAAARFAREHGYRVAQVTVSFDDYAYNEPYARCLDGNDRAAIDWMKESFLRRAAASLEDAQETAKLVYDRDIPHVMLLHVGGFQTVMLPKLLALIEERGFRLVTLEEAQSDPAYAIDPAVALSYGATLLQQIVVARGLGGRSSSDEALARLAALCRGNGPG